MSHSAGTTLAKATFCRSLLWILISSTLWMMSVSYRAAMSEAVEVAETLKGGEDAWESERNKSLRTSHETCEDLVNGLHHQMYAMTQDMAQRASECSGNMECLRDTTGRVDFNKQIAQSLLFLQKFMLFQRSRVHLGDEGDRCQQQFMSFYASLAPRLQEHLQTMHEQASEFKWLGGLDDSPSSFIGSTRQKLVNLVREAGESATTPQGSQVRPSVSWTDPGISQAWWRDAKKDEAIQNVVEWWKKSEPAERRQVDVVSGIRYHSITDEDKAQDRIEEEEERKAEEQRPALEVGQILNLRKSLQKPYRWCWAQGDHVSYCHSKKKKRVGNATATLIKRKCLAFKAKDYTIGEVPTNVNMVDVTLLPCAGQTPGIKEGKCVGELIGEAPSSTTRYYTEIVKSKGRLLWGICLHEGDHLGKDGPSKHLSELIKQEKSYQDFIASIADGGGEKQKRHKRRHRSSSNGSKTSGLLELIELGGEDSESDENGTTALIVSENADHLEAARSRFILGWLQAGLGGGLDWAVRCAGGLLEITAILGAVAVKTVALAMNVVPWLFLQGARALTWPLKLVKMQWLRSLIFFPFCGIIFKFSKWLKDGTQWLLETIFSLFNWVGASMARNVWGDRKYESLGGTGDEPFGLAPGTRKLVFGCCDQWLDGLECCESQPECCPNESKLKAERRNGQPYTREISDSFNPLDVCADVSDLYKPENILTDATIYTAQDKAEIRQGKIQLQADIAAEKRWFATQYGHHGPQYHWGTKQSKI